MATRWGLTSAGAAVLVWALSANFAVAQAPAVRQALERACPQKHLADLSPAEMLDLQDGFRSTLPAERRAALDHVLHKHGDEGAIGLCVGHDGASCDVGAYDRAFVKLKLTTRFARHACSQQG